MRTLLTIFMSSLVQESAYCESVWRLMASATSRVQYMEPTQMTTWPGHWVTQLQAGAHKRCTEERQAQSLD